AFVSRGRAQETRVSSSSSGSSDRTGLLPVMISRSTTPKEKTSDRSVIFPVLVYSGAMYLPNQSYHCVLFRSGTGKRNGKEIGTLGLPESPHHPRRNMAIVSVLDLGQPKVGDLGLKVVIEKDVGRLDVAMDDLRMTVLVQVCQALGRPERDPPPALPVQQRRSVAGVVQVGLERVVGDVLVDEQPLVAMDAVPQQRDEVAVVHAADALHLGAELALALPAAGPEPLDGHLPRRRARAQRAAVHVPEPALPQQLGVREPVRRRRQVRVRHRAARDRRVRGRLVGGRGAAAALPRADRCVWRWWWRVHWRYG
uniref:Uncharacterized protein n=1 Tax=Aegilops tauschii subsp. strangulata TaxID=200361 RepID=A0A452ZK61_AEGTS